MSGMPGCGITYKSGKRGVGASAAAYGADLPGGQARKVGVLIDAEETGSRTR